MTHYSTVIFDLDGTLLDTLEDLHLTLNHTLAALGMPTRTLAETRAFVGNGIRRLIERAVPAGTDEATVAKANAEFDTHYAVHCNDHTRPYPGVPELLARLRGRGVRLAVVSNKTQYAVDELVGIHFEGAFDAVVGVRPGVARKPARDMVDVAIAEMGGVACGPSVYVGDSEVDVATAAAAELPCLSVSWGFRTPEQLAKAGAATICATADELERALDGTKGTKGDGFVWHP